MVYRPQSFPPNQTINWSDLVCTMPSWNLNLFTLQIFGSNDHPPYHLQMCEKSPEDNGPYCETPTRIHHGLTILKEKYGEMAFVIFQTVGWDVACPAGTMEERRGTYGTRLREIRELAPRAKIVLRTVPTGVKTHRHDKMVEFNKEVVRGAARDFPSRDILLLDLLALFPPEGDPAYFNDDHFHFNAQGNDWYFEQLITFVFGGVTT